MAALAVSEPCGEHGCAFDFAVLYGPFTSFA